LDAVERKKMVGQLGGRGGANQRRGVAFGRLELLSVNSGDTILHTGARGEEKQRPKFLFKKNSLYVVSAEAQLESKRAAAANFMGKRSRDKVNEP
jgi:hypothetical protein